MTTPESKRNVLQYSPGAARYPFELSATVNNAGGTWLTYSSVTKKYLYLYSAAAPLWITNNLDGTKSGPVKTGEDVMINIQLTYANQMGWDSDNGFAAWFDGSDFSWQLYTDDKMTKGDLIHLPCLSLLIYNPSAYLPSKKKAPIFLISSTSDPDYIEYGDVPVDQALVWTAAPYPGAVTTMPAPLEADNGPRRRTS